MTPSVDTPSRTSTILWIPPALLFIAAAASKLGTSFNFLYELSNYGFRFSPLSEAGLAIALPAVEMWLGLSLLLRRAFRAAIGSLLLLVLFSAGILISLPAGYLHHCGCLGPEKLNPLVALLKNGVAFLFLILGFIRWKFPVRNANPWAALGLILGGAWSGIPTLLIALASLFFTRSAGKKHRIAFGLAFLLGVFLYLTHFPLLTLVVAATVLYFFPVDRVAVVHRAPVILSSLVLFISSWYFMYPPAPKAWPMLLQVGKLWPKDLSLSSAPPPDKRQRRLVLFLRPDCDECRDWLPQAVAIGQSTSLPPLLGLIPQSSISAENYRARENLNLPIFAVPARTFTWAVRRTPLLVLVRDDSVRTIFSEGSLPSTRQIEQLISHAQN